MSWLLIAAGFLVGAVVVVALDRWAFNHDANWRAYQVRLNNGCARRPRSAHARTIAALAIATLLIFTINCVVRFAWRSRTREAAHVVGVVR